MSQKKRKKIDPEKFERILGESLKFHGLLTAPSVELPGPELSDHLSEPSFLFKKNEESIELPKFRIAAFRSSKKRKE